VNAALSRRGMRFFHWNEIDPHPVESFAPLIPFAVRSTGGSRAVGRPFHSHERNAGAEESAMPLLS